MHSLTWLSFILAFANVVFGRRKDQNSLVLSNHLHRSKNYIGIGQTGRFKQRAQGSWLTCASAPTRQRCPMCRGNQQNCHWSTNPQAALIWAYRQGGARTVTTQEYQFAVVGNDPLARGRCLMRQSCHSSSSEMRLSRDQTCDHCGTKHWQYDETSGKLSEDHEKNCVQGGQGDATIRHCDQGHNQLDFVPLDFVLHPPACGSGWSAGQYNTDDKIGTGGNGDVFRGFCQGRNGAPATKAIKRFNTKPLFIIERDNYRQINQFRKKLELRKRIIQVEESSVAFAGGPPQDVLLMDLIIPLDVQRATSWSTQNLRRSPRLQDELATCMKQILEAIIFLHANSAVWLDIKENNIGIQPNGHCVLIDAGSFKQQSEGTVSQKTNMQAFWQRLMLRRDVGKFPQGDSTAGHQPPDVSTNLGTEHSWEKLLQCDVYALGYTWAYPLIETARAQDGAKWSYQVDDWGKKIEQHLERMDSEINAVIGKEYSGILRGLLRAETSKRIHPEQALQDLKAVLRYNRRRRYTP